MKSGLDKTRPELLHGLMALVLCFVATKAQIGSGILDDRFHYGEYFASLVTILNDKSFIPLTIHGSLDYLPGLISINLFEKENYLFYTQLIYLIFTFFSCLILYLILYNFSCSNIQNVINALIVPHLTDYRDFSILLLIFYYFIAVSKSSWKYNFSIQFFLGLLGALNFYYSTNRGVAGTISIGIVIIFFAFHNRNFIIAIISFLFFVLIASYISPILSLYNYLENLLFLAKTSYQWSYGFQYQALLLSIFLALWLIITLILNFKVSYNVYLEKSDIKLIGNFILLALLSIFYFQIGSYRADFTHIKMGLVIFIISFNYYIYLLNKNSIELNILDFTFYTVFILSCNFVFKQDKILGVLFFALFLTTLIPIKLPTISLKIASVLSQSLLVLFFLSTIWTEYRNGSYGWLRSIHNPIANSSAVDPSVNWASHELIRTESKCIFDLSNNGLINAITNLPTCTRFSYIVYADKKFESEIIDSLSWKKPNAIVYSSDYWSYNIDNKNMINRFPELDLYIKNHYKKELCNFGYCIRYLD